MFSSTIIYLELFVALFFLPGFFLTLILGIKKFRFLLSFALSYSLLVLTLLPFEYYGQPIAHWQWCILAEWVVLAVWATVKIFTYRNCKKIGQGLWPRRPDLIRCLLSSRLIVPLSLAGVICGYLAYAGPYLEIPSDVWEHVRRSQWMKLSVLDNEYFPPGLALEHLVLPPALVDRYYGYWDVIRAWLCRVSGLPIMDSIHVLTFVNVLIFLLAIYYFGLFLFSGLRISALKKTMMSAVASLFAAATMGNMVFAYIRYYTFAPTILNYVLFLAAMAVIIAWLRSNRWFDGSHHKRLGHAIWIVPVLVIVTGMVHTQETLFIFFMTLALSIVESVRVLWRKRYTETMKTLPTPAFGLPAVLPAHIATRSVAGGRTALQAGHPSKGGELTQSSSVSDKTTPRQVLIPSLEGQGWVDNHWSVREWKTIITAAVLLTVFFAGLAAIRHFKPGAWISNNMIMPNVAIPSEPVNFIFRNLMVAPPHNPWLRLAVYQLFIFYQVVGCWGLFVYFLFALMIRRFVKIPYLTAGMVIVPLLTVFNPFTIDLIARMSQSAALYRFIYLIPLPFVGGYLFVHFVGKAREWSQKTLLSPARSVSSIWPRLSWINFVGSILVLAGLIGLVFPINAAGIYAPYSKIYTLRKIPAANDYHLFDDLGKIMAKHENKVILTDSWTAGYLWLYSPKNTYCNPKWLNSSNPDKESPEPYAWEKLSNRGLIVINRRNGAPSITGKIAKHWPEDVLPKVSRNYSLEAQHYLESHPEKFPKIWSRNRIAIYAVR